MAIKKWKKLRRNVVFSHKRLVLVDDEVLLPTGKKIHYLLEAPADTHSVAVIAVNSDEKVLLQREYRYPTDEIIWQLPGGSIEADESVEEAAKRELSEESGLSAESCVVIGWYYLNNGFSNQKQYVVESRCLFDRSLPADNAEFIENHWLTVAELNLLITEAKLRNASSLAALSIWEKYHTNKVV